MQLLPSKPQKCDSFPSLRYANSDVTGEWIDRTEPNDVAKAGDTFRRSYTVTSEGTTTLSDICITDEKFGSDCLECTVPDDAKLQPGEFFVCAVASLVSLLRRVGFFSFPIPHCASRVLRSGKAQVYDANREIVWISFTLKLRLFSSTASSPSLQYHLVRISAYD